jgi:hypothetical protein
MVGGALAGFVGLGWWMPLGILGIFLLISGPSMLIAWLKLRQRTLGPILEATGWAINGRVKINIPLGAYLTDAAVLVGFGLRAADVFGSGRIDWLWAFLGTLAALGAILIKAETDLVGVARHQTGKPPVQEAAAEMRTSGMALARRAAAAFKFHRLILGIEASLLILVLAIADQLRDNLFFSRLGVAVLAGIALLQTLLHLVSILASSRLK